MKIHPKGLAGGAFISLAVVFAACSNSDADNGPLAYESLTVNFTAGTSASAWQPQAEAGLFATCTRGGATHTLTSNGHYRLADNGSYLEADNEAEAIVTLAGDHNYSFHAYSPFDPSVANATAVEFAVEPVQYHAQGIAAYQQYAASAAPTAVVADVQFDFKPVFPVLELNIANDILDPDGNSELSSITVSAPENCALVAGGSYNLETGILTEDASKQSNTVKLDFGPEGIMLKDSYTKVQMLVAATVIPAEGLDVTIAGLHGSDMTCTILAGGGVAPLEAGKTTSVTISSINDGVVPVSFPVEWLLGHGGEDRHPVTESTQPLWKSAGIWTCDGQPQAVCQWVKASDPLSTASQFLETVNSGKISSVGVKGLWTDDYFEFDIPVRKFAAGTVVTMSFPLYGRQIPVFWDIDYLDGEEWKTVDKTLKTAYDTKFSFECSFTVKRGATMVTKALPFEHEILSGHLKIRLRVADGSVQADSDTGCARRTSPWLSGGAYGAPFYFYDTNGKYTSIKFTTD